MRRALALAAEGRYRTSPNPMVGCVIVRDDTIVGEGYHAQCGGPHAEVVALARAGELARGATLFVTLEPCCHEGRTGACTEAILDAGVSRVVATHRDPNPVVSGKGFDALRQAGVEVQAGVETDAAVRLNWKFLVGWAARRPAVTLKWAMSLDGKIATVTAESQWISSPEGREWSMALREEHDAILVGIGTLLADDARLSRRLGLAHGRHVRVILDRQLRCPVGAAALAEAGELLIFTEVGASKRRADLEARGAIVLQLSAVTPEHVLAELYERDVRSVLVEGGGEIHASFVASGLYDRVEVDCAPLLLGGRSAPGPLGGAGFASLREAPRLEGVVTRRRGEDVLIQGFRQGCLPELSSSVDA